jgi:oxygen-independent coproporphyrinogen-3 oxidase
MIYVHVPFCRSFCTYCDFYSEVAPKCRQAEDTAVQNALFERFADALAVEIKTRKEEIQSACAASGVKTLYIGGGTPSVLPLGVFRKVLETLKEVDVSGDFAEFTVEVNPEDIVEKGIEYVEGLLELGVNRVSMGVQSFDDGILKWMNRRHDSATAVKAYRILEDAGVRNISIDLIFGLPQLSDELWRETLDKALNISSRGVLPQHISSYQLSVEPGSMLAKLVERYKWSEASDELCQRQYNMLCERLAAAGYHHYEISNFAQPGHEAVHNSAYWRHIPYIGLGPGAHSFIGPVSRRSVPASRPDDENYERKWNEGNLNAYLKAGECRDFTAVSGGETLDEEQLAIEKIMLGLRTSSGISEDYLRQHCDVAALDSALHRGSLTVQAGGTVRIPESSLFVSDSIISALL